MSSSNFRSPRHAQEIVVADWQDAELLAEWHMRHVLHLVDVARTGAGVDGGVDVVAAGAAAQVKHYVGAQTPVGAPDLQRLYGAALGRVGLFYSATGWTEHAREYAAVAKLALFTFDIYGNVAPSNARAAGLVEEGVRRSQPAPGDLLERARAVRAAESSASAGAKAAAHNARQRGSAADRRAAVEAMRARQIAGDYPR